MREGCRCGVGVGTGGWWAVVRGVVVLAWRGHVSVVVSECGVVVAVGGSGVAWVLAGVEVGTGGLRSVLRGEAVAWWGHVSVLVVGCRFVGVAFGGNGVFPLGVVWRRWGGQPRGRLGQWRGPGRHPCRWRVDGVVVRAAVVVFG